MIHFNSNHPIEHKLAVFHLLLKRMQQCPLSISYKQKGMDHNSTHCKANGFPYAFLKKLNTQILHTFSLQPTNDTPLTNRKNGSHAPTIIP